MITADIECAVGEGGGTEDFPILHSPPKDRYGARHRRDGYHPQSLLLWSGRGPDVLMIYSAWPFLFLGRLEYSSCHISLNRTISRYQSCSVLEPTSNTIWT